MTMTSSGASTDGSEQEPWSNIHGDTCTECGSDDVNFYGVEPQFGKCNECGNQWKKDYPVARRAGKVARSATENDQQ